HKILRTQSQSTKCVDGERDELCIGAAARLSEDVAVELIVLTQPSLLLALIAEHLRDAIPLDRFAKRTAARTNHSCQGRRHLRPQRHLALALIDEVVKLANDLVPRLSLIE